MSMPTTEALNGHDSNTFIFYIVILRKRVLPSRDD